MGSVCTFPPVPVQGEQHQWESQATFTGEEVYFEDHFPGFPIVPGVLLFEAMRETSSAVLEPLSRKVRLVRCTHVRLIRPCIPPVTVKVVVRVESGARGWMTRCEVRNGEGKRLASARLFFEPDEAACRSEEE